MTLSHWRSVALVSLLASLVVVIVSVRAKVRAEQDAARAVVALDSVTSSLHDAESLASDGLLASAAHRRTVDSLWAVIRAVQYAPVPRQRTTFVVDTADIMAVTQALATMTAERDTAIIDRDSARAMVGQIRLDAEALGIAALEHLRADSLRFAQIAAHVEIAATGVQNARAAIRPRWWERLGHGVVSTVKIGTVAAVAFFAGRHS